MAKSLIDTDLYVDLIQSGKTLRSSVNVYERKNTELIKEFNRYVREHPDFADDIPKEAIVITQLEGDSKFNQWGRKLKPLRSRIEKLELKRVA